MDDYSVEELHNISNKIILAYEDDQDYILKNIINSDIELMPLRFSYDLSNYSDEYIEKTKRLFIYYASKDNTKINEIIKIRKHFKHFMRTPNAAYVPNNKELDFIIDILNEIGIKVFSSLEESVQYLKY